MGALYDCQSAAQDADCAVTVLQEELHYPAHAAILSEEPPSGWRQDYWMDGI